MNLKSFALAFTVFIVIDYIWLAYIIQPFYLKELAHIGRISDGQFDVWLAPAIGVYVLMALLLTVFVLPVAGDGSWVKVFLLGCLMGFSVYGVFDLTNAAILKNYPMAFAAVDMAWGTLSFGAVSLIVRYGPFSG